MSTEFLLNKDKSDLYKTYDDPNFLKLKKLEDYISYENAILVLINLESPFSNLPLVNCETDQESIILKDLKYDHDQVKEITFKFKGNLLTNNNIFLYTYGVTSSQRVQINRFPKLNKFLKNDFIEKKIFDITKNELNADGISNIYVQIDYAPVKNDIIECVLKIDGAVICSQLILNSQLQNFIMFPNVLWISRKTMPKFEIYLRSQKSFFDSLYNFNFSIHYDTIYLELNSREKIVNYHKYMFETANNIIIVSLEGKFGIRYFTQFIESLDSKIKFLYDSSNILNSHSTSKYEIEDIKIAI